MDGTELVVGGAAGTRRTGLTTIRAAAEFAGVTPGAPAQVYEPATPLDLDEPLMIDPGAARLVADWYQLGAQALSRLAAEVPGDQPSPAVLWPEHFDVGITAAAINYGASPGDDHIAWPYLYVGPHEGAPPGDPRSGTPRSAPPAPAARSTPWRRRRPSSATAGPAPRPPPHQEDIMKGLQDKVALVTGGSSGIGQAIAIRLGEESANVAINYVGRPEDAVTTREAIEHGVEMCMKKMTEAGGRPILVEADVSDEHAVGAMYDPSSAVRAAGSHPARAAGSASRSGPARTSASPRRRRTR